MGCGVLDTAYVAAGRFDAAAQKGNQPWDRAAGILLVTEAGGKATTSTGEPASPWVADIVVSNGHLHEEMLKLGKP